MSSGKKSGKARQPKRRKCLICGLVITKAKVCKANEYICQPCMYPQE